MANLLDSVWEYAEHENITPKQVAALLLMMVSNDERDYTVSNICKEITPNVIFRSIKRGLRTSSWSFLIHFLSLGRRKYAEFIRFMKLENVTMTSYTKLTLFGSQVNCIYQRFCEKDHLEKSSTQLSFCCPSVVIVRSSGKW